MKYFKQHASIGGNVSRGALVAAIPKPIASGNFFLTGNSSLCRPQCPAQGRPERPRRRWGRRGGRRAEQHGRAGPGRAEPSGPRAQCPPGEAPLPRGLCRARMAGEPLSFRAFRAAHPEYGYGHGHGLSALRDREFPRLRGTGGSPGAGRPGPFPARFGPGREGKGRDGKALVRGRGGDRDAGRRRWARLAALISTAR